MWKSRNAEIWFADAFGATRGPTLARAGTDSTDRHNLFCVLLEFDFSAVAKMCDKEIEVIDLTLCGSSDEEEDPVKNSKASCSSPVLISSDLDLEDFEPAFEYVTNFLFLVKLADSISCLHFTCVTIGLKWKKTQYPVLLKRTLVLLIPSKSKVSLSLSLSLAYTITQLWPRRCIPNHLTLLEQKSCEYGESSWPDSIYIYSSVTGSSLGRDGNHWFICT